MKYDPVIVTAFFKSEHLPYFCYEYRFHDIRKWRFDLAWPEQKLYVEVQGGIWIAGKHSRGAAMKNDWEKWNTATCMGWRGLWCEPRDLCTVDFANTIKEAIAAVNATHQPERTAIG